MNQQTATRPKPEPLIVNGVTWIDTCTHCGSPLGHFTTDLQAWCSRCVERLCSRHRVERITVH